VYTIGASQCDDSGVRQPSHATVTKSRASKVKHCHRKYLISLEGRVFFITLLVPDDWEWAFSGERRKQFNNLAETLKVCSERKI
jgi:hypothetical protein